MCSTFRSPFKEAEKSVKAATNALRDYRNYQQKQDLSIAITHYRHAYETSNEKHNQYPDIIINYTALLNKQDRLSSEKSNLEEVIRLLQEAQGVMESRSSVTEKYGVLLNNLGQAYLDRYRNSRTSEDLASATRTFERARSRGVSSPGSSTYTTSLIGSATALWTACELQPQADNDDLSRLNAAIVFLETALNQNRRDIHMQAECLRHLAPVYDLRYKRSGNRNDLECSIKYYSEALSMLDSQSPNCAPALFNLSKQQFERHKLTKESEDLKAAERSIGAVKELVDKGLGTQDLKAKIEVLMDLYAKYGSTDASVGSQESAPVSRQITMGTIREEPDSFTGPANATRSGSNHRGTFASFDAGPSVNENLTSFTGQAQTAEPAEFAVSGESNPHNNPTSEPTSIAPSPSDARKLGGDEMVRSAQPGIVVEEPQATEPGQFHQITQGHQQNDEAGEATALQQAVTSTTLALPQHGLPQKTGVAAETDFSGIP